MGSPKKWKQWVQNGHPGRKLEEHRLKQGTKALLRTTAGLGNPLGAGLPNISKLDWEARQKRWAYNRTELQRIVPQIFTTDFFNSLRRLGGRSEGEVRELVFPRNGKFTSFSGMRWPKIAVKKFRKNSRSTPEGQARTLHSLHELVNFWIESGKLDIHVHVPEAITYQGPYLVMRSLSSKHYARADNLPIEERQKVFNTIMTLGKLIIHSEERLIKRFKEAGFQYPSPDFIPSNIMASIDKKGAVESIWILDQFSVPGGSTGEKALQHGSMRRLSDSSRWFPELTQP